MNGAALPLDPSLALGEVSGQDLVRRKLDMDALRQRLGDQAGKEEKLRESCEGFEAIFLQKMWEQMRKTVPKEGYLHSKDEETYQSLFDVELCKKMASAGGIGLADMLYEQLSQQLENTGRTTTPGSYRRPLEIAASSSLMAAAPSARSDAVAQAPLKAEDLYTALPEEGLLNEQGDPAEKDPVLGALAELEAGLAEEGNSEAVREWAQARDEATGVITASVGTASVIPASAPIGPASAASTADGAASRNSATSDAAAQASTASGVSPDSSTAAAVAQASTSGGSASPSSAASGPDDRASTAADAAARAGGRTEAKASADPALSSWQGPGPVSAKPKPVSFFGRNKGSGSRGESGKAEASASAAKAPAEARGLAPKDTLWPLDDGFSQVTSRFGWEDDPAGKRRWNPGVKIAAAPEAPVRAVLPGAVVYAGERDGTGHTVVLEHKGGFRSYYGHLQPGSVKVGDKINAGAEFAKIAAEPLSPSQGENSASLHFELKKGEMALNPESAILRKQTAG